MTAIRDRFPALRDRTKQLAVRVGRAGVGTGQRRVVLSVVALLVGVLAVAPSWWWHRLTVVIAGPGWRWLPVLLAAAGGIGLGAEAARRWRRGGAARRRPVAERVPLFGHIAVLLLLAAVVAVAVGTAVWAALGRPHVAVGTAGGTVPGGAAAWSVQNTFDAIKIVLAVVAGIGGVVALTVAYRKQDHGEAAEHRENTKLFNDRFGRAADQLGSGQAAVRLAGVYALAGLADDWAEGRQTCIDVLCAYLRMPYTPPPADTAPSPAGTTRVGLPLGSPTRGDDGPQARQERQVRHTLLALIGEHLRPVGADDRPRWQGHCFNLRGAVVDGGDLSGIDVPAGTVLDLTAATFPGGPVTFAGATFSGGTVDFGEAVFSGGEVYFDSAMFSGGTVDFADAVFSGSTVYFNAATFSSGTVKLNAATFSGGTVDFGAAVFSGGRVYFAAAVFSGGTVNFSIAEFAGGRLHFDCATFSGGEVYFDSAVFSGGTVDFADAVFSGSTVYFNAVTFSGGEVLLGEPREWSVPPLGLDGSEPGVSWPSPAHLAKIF